MTSLLPRARRALGSARRYARRLSGVDRDAPLILMYHRVASPRYDPWGLCVSPANFRDQLAALKSRRTILAMDDLVDALEAGSLPPRATALTFDDGYADNAEVAKPILEAMEVPATFFLATAFIGSEEPFWWDELAALVLAGHDTADFDFEAGGVRLAGRWEAQDEVPPDLPSWRTFDETPDPRRLAYRGLWRTLQELDGPARGSAMAELRHRLAGGTPVAAAGEGRPMSQAAARSMRSAFVALGGHGRTHVPLTALPPASREDEVRRGMAEVSALCDGLRPGGFAYPHGQWDGETRAIVGRAGYRWAVTTNAARIDRRRFDLLALPRIQVSDWDGTALSVAIGSAAP